MYIDVQVNLQINKNNNINICVIRYNNKAVMCMKSKGRRMAEDEKTRWERELE